MGETATDALRGLVTQYGVGNVLDGLRAINETDFNEYISKSWSPKTESSGEAPPEA